MQFSEVAGVIVLDHSEILVNPDNRQCSFVIGKAVQSAFVECYLFPLY